MSDANEGADIFEPGDSTCLICTDLPDYQAFMIQQMHSLDYKVHCSSNFEDIGIRLAAQPYNCILLFETIEGCTLESNVALAQIVAMLMDQRRDSFVCLIGPSVQTNDEMGAFVHSVDMTMGIHDVGNMKTLLRRSISRWEDTFRLFKELLRNKK